MEYIKEKIINVITKIMQYHAKYPENSMFYETYWSIIYSFKEEEFTISVFRFVFNGSVPHTLLLQSGKVFKSYLLEVEALYH